MMQKVFTGILFITVLLFGSQFSYAQENSTQEAVPVQSSTQTQETIELTEDSLEPEASNNGTSLETELPTVSSEINQNGEQQQEISQEEIVKLRETQRIQELRTLYRNQVEAYRNSEKAFSIAKTNYQNVQTLSALEEAVLASKTVFLDRSRVMITYLELIDAVLIETNGIELDLKNRSHTELFGLINALKIHQDEIAVSADRQSIAVLATNFEPIAFSYENAVYTALSLIRIGKMQEIHDKADIIHADIRTEHEQQEVRSVIISRRERAYAEIERNLETIQAGLVKLNETFQSDRNEGFGRSKYERILRDLGPVYAQTARSIEHLEELLKL